VIEAVGIAASLSIPTACGGSRPPLTPRRAVRDPAAPCRPTAGWSSRSSGSPVAVGTPPGRAHRRGRRGPGRGGRRRAARRGVGGRRHRAGEFRAGLPLAGPLTDLALQGRVQTGSTTPRALPSPLGWRASSRPQVRARRRGRGALAAGRPHVTALRLGSTSGDSRADGGCGSLELEEAGALRPGLGPALRRGKGRAERLNLVDAGRLGQTTATLRVAGDLASLEWRTEGRPAGGVGPVAGAGRWSASRVERPLYAGRAGACRRCRPCLRRRCRSSSRVGARRPDLTGAWPRGGDGPRLEGELRVADGRLAETHWPRTASRSGGCHFAPGPRMRLGGSRGGQVSAGRITAAVPAESLSVRVAGAWPWSARARCSSTACGCACSVARRPVDTLRLRSAPGAILRLAGSSSSRSRVGTGTRWSASGRGGRDLPLHLDHGSLADRDGSCATPPRSPAAYGARAIEAFKANQPPVSRRRQTGCPTSRRPLRRHAEPWRDGRMVVAATIEGKNPQRGDRPVRLNYRHEENLLHLYRACASGPTWRGASSQRLSPESSRALMRQCSAVPAVCSPRPCVRASSGTPNEGVHHQPPT